MKKAIQIIGIIIGVLLLFSVFNHARAYILYHGWEVLTDEREEFLLASSLDLTDENLGVLGYDISVHEDGEVYCSFHNHSYNMTVSVWIDSEDDMKESPVTRVGQSQDRVKTNTSDNSIEYETQIYIDGDGFSLRARAVSLNKDFDYVWDALSDLII